MVGLSIWERVWLKNSLSQLEGGWRGRGGSVYKAGSESLMTHMEVAAGYVKVFLKSWKESGKFPCFCYAFWSYYHSINTEILINEGKCISWQWAAYLMEIIADLLSCAVLEGDWTRRTVWTQTILKERWRNGDGTVTERWRNGNVTHIVNRP